MFGQEYFGIVANTNVLPVFPAFLLRQPIGNILKLKALSSIEQLEENICAMAAFQTFGRANKEEPAHFQFTSMFAFVLKI